MFRDWLTSRGFSSRILGSGLMGSTFGTILARAGHDVVFSYSRSQTKLKRLAREAGANARAGVPAEAVADADAILLAVHWSRLDDVLGQAGSLARRTVVTCSLPMTKNDSRMVLGLTTSGAETLATRLRKAHVVSAFSTAPGEVLFSVFAKRKRNSPIDLNHLRLVQELDPDVRVGGHTVGIV